MLAIVGISAHSPKKKKKVERKRKERDNVKKTLSSAYKNKLVKINQLISIFSFPHFVCKTNANERFAQ